LAEFKVPLRRKRGVEKEIDESSKSGDQNGMDLLDVARSDVIDLGTNASAILSIQSLPKESSTATLDSISELIKPARLVKKPVSKLLADPSGLFKTLSTRKTLSEDIQVKHDFKMPLQRAQPHALEMSDSVAITDAPKKRKFDSPPRPKTLTYSSPPRPQKKKRS
jgi:hypothetical protein